jgi:glycosidase
MFHGYEVMDDLKHNMFSSRFFGRDPAINWAKGLTEKGIERAEFIKKLNQMRMESSALCSGELRWLNHDSPDHVLAYVRERGGEKLLIIINMHKKPVTVTIEEIMENVNLLKPLLSKNVVYACDENAIQADMLGYGYLAGVL